MPLMIGAVRYANSETILLMDRTVFEAPAWMHLPTIQSARYWSSNTTSLRAAMR